MSRGGASEGGRQSPAPGGVSSTAWEGCLEETSSWEQECVLLCVWLQPCLGQGVGEGVNACPVGVSRVTPVPSQAGCGSWMQPRVEASPEARGAGARPWEAGGGGLRRDVARLDVGAAATVLRSCGRRAGRGKGQVSTIQSVAGAGLGYRAGGYPAGSCGSHVGRRGRGHSQGAGDQPAVAWGTGPCVSEGSPEKQDYISTICCMYPAYI